MRAAVTWDRQSCILLGAMASLTCGMCAKRTNQFCKYNTMRKQTVGLSLLVCVISFCAVIVRFLLLNFFFPLRSWQSSEL